METQMPLNFDMIQSGDLQMSKKTWLTNLSDSQYDCVVKTLEQIETSTKGTYYNIHSFPESFMISFKTAESETSLQILDIDSDFKLSKFF